MRTTNYHALVSDAPSRSEPPQPRSVQRRAAGGALGWPLVPLAPLVVILVGIAAAAAIGVAGLAHMSTASRAHAATRASLVADTLSARVAVLGPTERQDAVRLAARRTDAEIVVVDAAAQLVVDSSLGAPSTEELRGVVSAGTGELTTRAGRTAFSTASLPDGAHVLVFVPVPGAPEGAPALVQALLALTTLLIGVAAVVAFGVASDAEHDVIFVSRRILGMALVRTEPAGEPVPVRTMDEVGALTSAFNDLVARFAAAEAKYHGDLARASAADRDRAAFLAAMSHELRTPLHAILGFADVLLKEVDGPLPVEAREEILQIRESGVHLNALIEDILSFSALESGQLRLHPAEVNLLSIAQELVRQTSVVVLGRPLRVQLEGGPVFAWADAKRVRQLLGNLVGNAVKFTEKGEVVVRIGRRGRFAVVTVRDTGPGIARAEHQHVFEEYRQAAAERTQRRGTGLGLAIAQRLALAHGGSIELDSDLGRGATFTVLLPLAPRELRS